MILDPSLLLLVGFLAGAGFVLLLRFLWSRIPRSPAGWDGASRSVAARPLLNASGAGGAATAGVGTEAASPDDSPSSPISLSSRTAMTAPPPAVGAVGAPVASATTPRIGVAPPAAGFAFPGSGSGPPAGPTTPFPTSAPGQSTEPALRLSMRVVLHLRHQPRITRFDLAPLSMTQAGMVEGLNATQSALAKVLARLVAAGVLEERREHVQGQPRRLKVYQLTPTGEALARDLRRRSTAPQVPATTRPGSLRAQ
jgi:DNA-binding MarR family transcriptional regulator